MHLETFIAYPRHPEKLEKLYSMAYNLWFSWNYDLINLFYRIDSKLFRQSEHNPVKFLHNIPEEKINSLAEDDGFLFELEKVWSKFQECLNYKSGYECPSDKSIAYFSMEFGLHESIPIYAGGLGILAGDFLKGASDMDIPVIGVGLLYNHGYFTQSIDPSGNQQEIEKTPFDKSMIPIKELREPGGRGPLMITSEFAGHQIKAKIWQADIGKTKLILMDTNVEENTPFNRSITDGLYPSDREKRILQELLLGIGGIKALEATGCRPGVYHLNEGHSAFLIIARLKELMLKQSFTFNEAMALIKASTVFTTHTPVIAGNEHYPDEMVKKYLSSELKEIGIELNTFLNYGAINGETEIFWLPAFAMHFSGFTNGVSKRHSEVAHEMWKPIFPELAPPEIPIRHITNGVHNSWISEPVDDVFNRYLGPNYIHADETDEIWDKIAEIPDDEIWKAHKRNKQDMIAFLRKRLAESLSSRGYSPSKISGFHQKLNPDSLTIVFARRFASYKRPTLLLRNKEKLKAILSDTKRPIQLIFAGKAHPADEHGKKMIKEILAFAEESGFQDRIFFFENYDMNLARHLLWGADIWLNTPVEYNEASGTSGMKAAMNGVLNLSVIDGWWVEGFNGKNGWGISAEELSSHPELRESAEANQIYSIIEEEIADLYYNRDEFGVPAAWVAMMKESLSSVCRKFNINRALGEYMTEAYMPCFKKFEKLSENNFKLLKEASLLDGKIAKGWDGISFKHFESDLENKEQVTEGDDISVKCSLDLGGLDPDLVMVEIFYMPAEKDFSLIPLELETRDNGTAVYRGKFKVTGRGTQNMNIRVRPANETVRDMHPSLIKWRIKEDSE